MAIAPTFPGIYIEELPSTVHTITPAPTSVTVFVGYSNPFKTRSSNFGKAVQIFSFTDYEREFGGFFSSAILDNSLPNAVNDFYLNGGSDAYVVALQPSYWDASTNPFNPSNAGPVLPAFLDVNSKVRFIARELTDATHRMVLTIGNLQASNPTTPTILDVADITVSYGAVSETYRRVTINKSPVNPNDLANFIEKRLGTKDKPVSSLVTVDHVVTGAPDYGTDLVSINQVPLQFDPSPDPAWTTFNLSDFRDVFQVDSSLDKVAIFNLLVLPGVADSTIWSEALAFCERKRAFLLLDPPRQAAADSSSDPLPLIADLMDTVVPKSTNGAIYFPYLKSADPLTGAAIELPPSGFVAGICARTDANRGVWKAPAGLETIINGTTGVVERGRMNDNRQGTLNPKGINCIRSFPGAGTVVFGARTLVAENTAFEQWRYVPVRRMALFIEQSLAASLTWVIFEPNDDPLWVAIRTSIEAFMLALFNQGAFQGSTPSQAFKVRCDSTTTTQTDIDLGVVNIIVAFAPLKPAEFVIIKIAQLAGQAQS